MAWRAFCFALEVYVFGFNKPNLPLEPQACCIGGQLINLDQIGIFMCARIISHKRLCFSRNIRTVARSAIEPVSSWPCFILSSVHYKTIPWFSFPTMHSIGQSVQLTMKFQLKTKWICSAWHFTSLTTVSLCTVHVLKWHPGFTLWALTAWKY